MNCKTCIYWELITDHRSIKNIELGECTKVKILWDCTKWDAENFNRVLTEEHKHDKAFTQDASDYKADLLTRPDFGCVQWEKLK